MSTLQLKPKQTESLQRVLAQKNELNTLIAQLQQKESLILELIFEAAGITGDLFDVKLEGDKLTYETSTGEQNKPKKKSKQEPKKE